MTGLIADGNRFYQYFNSKEFTIEVSSVGSFSYTLINEYDTILEDFSFDFLLFPLTCIASFCAGKESYIS